MSETVDILLVGTGTIGESLGVDWLNICKWRQLFGTSHCRYRRRMKHCSALKMETTKPQPVT